MPREQGRKVVASNRKARHEYTILGTHEAGIALVGTEIKSMREGQASLVDAFATIDEAVQAMKDGAHDFLQKPVDSNHLRNGG